MGINNLKKKIFEGLKIIEKKSLILERKWIDFALLFFDFSKIFYLCKYIKHVYVYA